MEIENESCCLERSENAQSKEETENCNKDVAPIDPRFECPICLTWLKNPVLTSCGHRFCKDCIYSWLGRNTCCPVDNTELNQNIDIFPDNFTKREILEQKSTCLFAHRGCKEKLPPLEMENHIADCPFQQVSEFSCLLRDYGCNKKFQSQKEADEHLKKNMDSHFLMLTRMCNKLQEKLSHGPISASEQEANFWDPPEKSGDQNVKKSNDVSSLIKVLYEKIVVLEQKSREQEIILANMAQQLQAAHLDSLENTLRFCNGTYIWRLSSFESKLELMRNDFSHMFYSPGFYNSPFGYKFCLRMNVMSKDTDYVSLLVHMMKSNHDECLDWPFNGKIILTLIHPTDHSRNIKEAMMTRPDLEAFKRPIQSINFRGFGYTNFIGVNELLQGNFLKNDEIIVKVQIYQV